jgi:DNA-binding transcriptional regulator YdaS (Cro superfamily)
MGTKNTPLQRAVTLAGSQTELARRIGVQQAHVWNWLNRSKGKVPGEHVIPIEKATGVSRHELRPDLYPIEEQA